MSEFTPPQGAQELSSGRFEKWSEIGTTLIGRLLGYSKSTKYAGGFVGKMRTQDGPIAFSMTAILRDIVDSNELVGQWIAVQYTGKRAVKGGEVKEYKVWKLTAAPDWATSDAGDDDVPF